MMIANKDYALIKAIKNRCKCNGDSSSEGGSSNILDKFTLKSDFESKAQAAYHAGEEGPNGVKTDLTLEDAFDEDVCEFLRNNFRGSIRLSNGGAVTHVKDPEEDFTEIDIWDGKSQNSGSYTYREFSFDSNIYVGYAKIQ